MNSNISYYMAFFILFLSSCSRDPELLVEYRDHYKGIYQCEKTCSSWNMSVPGFTNTSENVSVTVEKDSETANGVIIDGDTIQIDATGSYSSQQSSSYGYSVTFRNDSIFINTHWGGLGGGTTCITTGVKE